MTGFEPESSGVKGNHSAHCTTTAQKRVFLLANVELSELAACCLTFLFLSDINNCRSLFPYNKHLNKCLSVYLSDTHSEYLDTVTYLYTTCDE